MFESFFRHSTEAWGKSNNVGGHQAISQLLHEVYRGEVIRVAAGGIIIIIIIIHVSIKPFKKIFSTLSQCSRQYAQFWMFNSVSQISL